MKAKPRSERTYPQAVRIYSTEEGTHPKDSGIEYWAPYEAVQNLFDFGQRVWDAYKVNPTWCTWDFDIKDPVGATFIPNNRVWDKFPIDYSTYVYISYVPYDDYLELRRRVIRLIARYERNIITITMRKPRHAVR